MYTLDGRIRFHLALRPEDEQSFHQKKLREIVLSRTAVNSFELSFLLLTPQPGESSPTHEQDLAEIPEYVMVEETP